MKPAKKSPFSPAIIQSTLDEAERLAGNESAQNTKRAYRADWNDWEAFAGSMGINPNKPDEEALRVYFTHLSAIGRKVATIERRKAGLAYEFEQLGYPGFFANSVMLKDLFKSIRRTKGKRQNQKDAIELEDLKQAVEAIDTKQLIGLRDKALILFGYAGAFRVSEIVSLNREDIAFESRGAKVLLERSKGDQEGAGFVKGIRNGKSQKTCPNRALRDWLSAAGITSGPVFRGWIPQGMRSFDLKYLKDTPLSARRAREIIKGRFVTVLDVSNISFHSLRISFVTNSAKAGATNRQIKGVSGHKTDKMVNHYIQENDPFAKGVDDNGL